MIFIDISNKSIRPSKHFVLKWMRRWDWDIYDLRKAIETAYKIDKVGKYKYEVYSRQKSGKSKKIILIADEAEIFIISGAEGK